MNTVIPDTSERFYFLRAVRSSAHAHLPTAHWSVRSSSDKFSSDPALAQRVKDLSVWAEAFFMGNTLTDIKQQVSNITVCY